MSGSPKLGDIILLDFNPQSGHEQAGKRPALVMSPESFNKATGFAFVCPVTNQKKGYPFEIEVTGTNATTGVILADQLKSLDWKSRKFKRVDKVDQTCIDEVKSMIGTILSIN